MKSLIKKEFLPFILILILVGCSSNNDDDSQSKSSLFIGTWKPVKSVDVCSTGSEDIEILSTCEQTGRLSLNSNGTYSETYFYEYIDNICEEDGVSNGTWKIDNDKLFVIESEFGETEITFFEIEGNILRVGQYEEDPEFTCDGDNLPSHYYREYIKI